MYSFSSCMWVNIVYNRYKEYKKKKCNRVKEHVLLNLHIVSAIARSGKRSHHKHYGKRQFNIAYSNDFIDNQHLFSRKMNFVGRVLS